MIPGQIIPANDPVIVNEGLPVTTVHITNTGPITIQLTAHFHVFEANRSLMFDRRKAYGMRLDVHAKGAVRIAPAETVAVDLVPIGGERVIYGFHGLVDGPLDDIGIDAALTRLIERGFLHESEEEAGDAPQD